MTLCARQAVTAVLSIVVFTVLLGVVYPFAVWAVGQVAASGQVAGSYVRDASGTVVGSSLIGQSFRGPQWFQGRPSAAGTGYDAMSSGASNLSASNPTLLAQVQQRKAAIAEQDGVAPSEVQGTFVGWDLLSTEPADTSGMPAPMKRTNPSWYRLRATS